MTPHKIYMFGRPDPTHAKEFGLKSKINTNSHMKQFYDETIFIGLS